MQLRLGGSGGDAEHLGDLLVLVAFHIVECEDPPRPFGQCGDRLLQIHPVAGRVVSRDEPVDSLTIVISIEPIVPSAFRFPFVEHEVHRDPVQPGAKRRFAPKQVQLLPGANEHVLGELLGTPAIIHHPHAQRVHSRDVQMVQTFEGEAVSGRGECHVRVSTKEGWSCRSMF